MMNAVVIILIIAGFIISFLGGILAIKLSNKLNLARAPNYRDSHKYPTPRSGAIGLVFVLCAGLIYFDNKIAALGVAVMAMVGLIDDLKELPPKIKFAGQLIAMGVLFDASAFGVIHLANWQFSDPHWLIISLWAIMILWWVNLFNFMDGINGIALIQAFTMILNCLILQYFDSQAISPMNLVAMAGILGLFILNIQGKLFMGDVGALALGLFIIYIIGNFTNDWLLIAIMGAVFWWDATICLILRALQGKNPLKAHRSHAYQKLAVKFQSHSKISWAVGVYNIFWILPISYFYFFHELSYLISLILVFLPLILIVWYAKVGLDDTK